jgi:hypothetical protein
MPGDSNIQLQSFVVQKSASKLQKPIITVNFIQLQLAARYITWQLSIIIFAAAIYHNIIYKT